MLFLISFYHSLGFTQPLNDACESAVRLCPGEIYTGTTIDATSEATDFNVCYTSENSVWFAFTTNSVGGSATVNFTNLTFNPDPDFGQNLQALFFKTGGDCGVAPFTPFSNCGDSSTDFALNETTPLAPNTTYYVQVSGSKAGATNASACTFDIQISGPAVEVPNPSVTITTADSDICQGENETISTTISDCIDVTKYNWMYDGATIFEDDINNFSTALLTNSGTLALTITCGANCPKTATSNSINYTVTPTSAEAGEDAFIAEGDQANLVGSGIGVPVWSPASTLTNSTTLATTASPKNTTTYFLTMENNGCFATDSVTVFVGQFITIFSAFTPNGDNINDRWHILNSEKFPNMEVNVYSRFGQLVFSAVNYSQESQWWDGTFKGKELPVSTYYYVIRLNDSENTEYKGQVNILR